MGESPDRRAAPHARNTATGGSVLVPAREVGREGSAVLSVVGLKGARRWRLLWSLQRPRSERSEEMSLSGRQRRGAFKLCWSDIIPAVTHPIIEV
jgi:hypothetical protein